MKKIIKVSIYLVVSLVLISHVFFRTELFAYYRDLYVLTAMSTSNHKYLATMFLSDEEIEEILADYVIENNTNSSSEEISIDDKTQNITIEEISGDTYTGYVVLISDPTAVSIVDAIDGGSGKTLGTIVEENTAIVGINAGGFGGTRRNNSGGVLDTATIINKELLYGEEDETYSLIGLSETGVLILGNYTYQEALDAGIDDALEFGPFLIVNGIAQVTNQLSGGYQPRTAIGQTQDGTIILVVIEGRTTSSLGATYYDIQEVMLKYEAYNAANLDGGGSSTLYYEGELINTLSNKTERKIPNAIIVK